MKTWPEKNLMMMMTGEVKKLQLPLHHGHETVCYNGVHAMAPNWNKSHDVLLYPGASENLPVKQPTMKATAQRYELFTRRIVKKRTNM